MSRTYRRKNIKSPSWVVENYYKDPAWFHSDSCKFGTKCSQLHSWAKKQLRQEARTKLNQKLKKTLVDGTEESLCLEKEHVASDIWKYT